MPNPLFTRDLLEKHFRGDYRMIAAFEEQETQIAGVTATVSDTSALKDATVVVLSANGDFTNEYVLALGSGLSIRTEPGKVTISVDYNKLVNDGELVTIGDQQRISNKTLVAPALSDQVVVSDLGNYASDSAAASGGVPVGGLYRNGSAVQVRVA